jgi:hypothetical protein
VGISHDIGQVANVNSRLVEGSVTSYTDAVYAFLTEGGQQTKIDFKSRHLVLVGHSMGGTCASVLPSLICGYGTECTFSSGYRTLLHEREPRIPFKQVILYEASINPDGPLRQAVGKALTGFLWTRKDTWVSRKAAVKELTASPAFSGWDPKAQELHFVSSSPAADLTVQLFNLSYYG